MGYIVGLTGGIGSGKTTIANLFAEYDVPIIDADIVARQVVEKGSLLLEKIAQHFGPLSLTESGELNRRYIRQQIFATPAEKQWLNDLLHPAIRQEMIKQLQQVQAPYVLFVVPLLIENQLTSLCDRILIIDVDPEIQFTRALQRDQSNEQTIRSIIASQVSREERLNYADDIIENNLPLGQGLAKIKAQVQKLHQDYLMLAEQKERECQKR